MSIRGYQQRLNGFLGDDGSGDVTDLVTGDDLLASMPDDTSALTANDLSAPAPATITVPSVDITDPTGNLVPGGAYSPPSILTNLLTSLTSAATQAITGTPTITSATNATRIQQGLAPLNANGTVMTAAQMQAAGYTSGQISTVSSQLAGGSSGLLLAGIGILGLVMFMGMRKRG